jgi:hypothetical protein
MDLRSRTNYCLRAAAAARGLDWLHCLQLSCGRAHFLLLRNCLQRLALLLLAGDSSRLSICKRCCCCHSPRHAPRAL